MKLKHLKRALVVAALGCSAALLASTAAGAATLNQPPGFFTGTVQIDRAAGSETTFYVMNQVADLYTQSSLYGCVLQSTDNRTCNTAADNPANTDVNDDYSRTEIDNGAGVGSSGGIGQLCGTSPTGGLVTDFARSSRALKGSDCAGLDALGFAKDAVEPVDAPGLNTTAIACTGTCSATQVGPVAAGWRTGDPLAGPYSGSPFNNMTSTTFASVANSDIVYRIYCASGGSGITAQITDWGQLTDTAIDPNGATDGNPGGASGTLGQIGEGSPIGAKIYIPFVNPNSGTVSTYTSYVGCTPNQNATDGSTELVQENDVPQLNDVAKDDHPTDNIAQANQVAESLYFTSFGVSQWHPYTLGGFKLMKVDGVVDSPAKELTNAINTVRTLYNVVLPAPATGATLRASVAGFLNWVCDTDTGDVRHGKDLTTGVNYSTELTNLITTQFVFPRIDCASQGNGVALSASQIVNMNS